MVNIISSTSSSSITRLPSAISSVACARGLARPDFAYFASDTTLRSRRGCPKWSFDSRNGIFLLHLVALFLRCARSGPPTRSAVGIVQPGMRWANGGGRTAAILARPTMRHRAYVGRSAAGNDVADGKNTRLSRLLRLVHFNHSVLNLALSYLRRCFRSARRPNGHRTFSAFFTCVFPFESVKVNSRRSRSLHRLNTPPVFTSIRAS